MKHFLPYVVDTVTVLVGVVCLVILIPILLGNNRLPGPDLEDEVIGQRLDVSGVDFSAQSETLIMVLASDCVFCQLSMPFYRRLLEAERGGVRIVVAASPVDTVIESYLTAEGVNPDSVVFVASPLPVRGTPALLLTDREGVVTHAWVGLLDADRESEVLSEIAPA